MARKRTHTDAPRTKLVSVRLREDTYQRVTATAAAASMSRASYVETLIEGGAVKVEAVNSDALPVALTNELKRLGSNLNQIAHARNAQLPTDTAQLNALLTEIIETICGNEVLRRRGTAHVSVEARLNEINSAKATPAPAPAPAAEALATPAAPPRSPREVADELGRALNELVQQVKAKRDVADGDVKEVAPPPPSNALGPRRPVPPPPMVTGPSPIPRWQTNQRPTPRSHLPPAPRNRLPPDPKPMKGSSDDPEAARSRPKFPWSLFVRSPRR